jgi:hypothetical protein
MMATFTTNQAGGNADYMRYLYGEVKKTDKANSPTLLDFGLVDYDGSLSRLHRGAHIILDTTTYGRWFTGFVTNEPSLSYLGSEGGKPQYGYIYQATSEEYLLNIKPFGIIPAFLNMTQGAILKNLIAQLTPVGFSFDVTAVDDGNLLPRYVVDPNAHLLDVVQEFTKASFYTFSVRDYHCSFMPQDSVLAGLVVDGADKNFTPSALTYTATSDSIVNDAIILGDIEPQSFMNEWFVGDGITAQFPLISSVFGVDSTLLLDDDFSASTVDNTKWTIYDPTGTTLVPSGGFLNVLGGSNIGSLDVSLQSQSLISIEGDLRLTHGEIDFVSASDGVFGSLWSQDVNGAFSGCLYGVRCVKSGANTILHPICNGVVDTSQSFTVDYTKRYIIRTLSSTYINRRFVTPYSYRSAAGVVGTTGGYGFDDSAAFHTIITEIDPSDALVTNQVQWDNTITSLSDLIQFALYVSVAANDMHCSVTGVTITSPLHARLLDKPSGGSAYVTQIIGPNEIDSLDGLAPVATIVDANSGVTSKSSILGTSNYNPGQATLTYFKDSVRQLSEVPPAGDLIQLAYRSAGSAVGRSRLSESVNLESQAWGDDGVRSITRNDIQPLPRTAEECEAAAAALVFDSSYQRYQGTYNLPSGSWFTSEPVAGSVLTFANLPSAFGPSTATTVVTPNSGGVITMNRSGDPPILPNWYWAMLFSDFDTPSLPSDAVILGIYPVVETSYSGLGGGASVFYGTSLTPWSTSAGGTGFPVPGGNYSGEYYGASIGTNLSALMTQEICARIFRTSVSSDLSAQTITALGYAIEYTSAGTPPYVSTQIPAPFTVTTGHSLAWSLPHTVEARPGFTSDNGSAAAYVGVRHVVDTQFKAEAISEVDTVFSCASPTEHFEHAITFGPLSILDRAIGKFADRTQVFMPKDTVETPVFIDPSSLGSTAIPSVTNPSLLGFTGTHWNFDTNYTPPAGQGFEIRYTDSQWGTDDGSNLVMRTASNTFSIPRNNRGKISFLRVYDTRNKWLWSDDWTQMTPVAGGYPLVLTHGENPQNKFGQYTVFTPSMSFPSVSFDTGVAATNTSLSCWTLCILGAIGTTATLTTQNAAGTSSPITRAVVCNGDWQRVSLPFLTDVATGTVICSVTASAAVSLCQASLEVGTSFETLYCKTAGTAYGALSRYSTGLHLALPLLPPAPTVSLVRIDAIPQWSAIAALPVIGNFIGIFGEIPLTGGGTVLITGGQGAANGSTITLPSGYTSANSLVWTTPGEGYSSGTQISGVHHSTCTSGVFDSAFQNRSNGVAFTSTSNWMAAAWTSGAAVTQSTVGSVTYLSFTTALGDDISIAVGSIPAGDAVSVPSGFTAANFQHIVGMSGTSTTGHGMQGVEFCYLDSSLNLEAHYGDNDGNFWTGSANVFGIFWKSSGGVSLSSVTNGTSLLIPTTTGNAISLIMERVSDGGTLSLPGGFSTATVVATCAMNGFNTSGSNVSHGWPQCEIDSLVCHFGYQDGSGHMWGGGSDPYGLGAAGRNIFAIAALPYSAPVPVIPPQTVVGYTYTITLEFIPPALLQDVWGYELRADDDTTVLYHEDLVDGTYTGEVTIAATSRSALYYLYSYNLLGEYSAVPNTASFGSVAPDPITNLRVDDSTATLLWDFSSTLISGSSFSVSVSTDNTFVTPTVQASTAVTSFPIPQSEFFADRFFRVVYADPLGLSAPVTIEHVYTPTGVTAFGSNEAIPVEPPPTGSSSPVPPSNLPAAYDSLYDSLSLAI